MSSLGHGLPSRGVRLNETQPLLRSDDFEEPIYLDSEDGRIKFRGAPQLLKLTELGGSATHADLLVAFNGLVRAWNRMLVSDSEAGVREP